MLITLYTTVERLKFLTNQKLFINILENNTPDIPNSLAKIEIEVSNSEDVAAIFTAGAQCSMHNLIA